MEELVADVEVEAFATGEEGLEGAGFEVEGFDGS